MSDRHYENFDETLDNDIPDNETLEIYLDYFFLNVNFVHVGKYEVKFRLSFFQTKQLMLLEGFTQNFLYWKESLRATDAVLGIIQNDHDMVYRLPPFLRNVS